jgi:hypothetical protein
MTNHLISKFISRKERFYGDPSKDMYSFRGIILQLFLKLILNLSRISSIYSQFIQAKKKRVKTLFFETLYLEINVLSIVDAYVLYVSPLSYVQLHEHHE